MTTSRTLESFTNPTSNAAMFGAVVDFDSSSTFCLFLDAGETSASGTRTFTILARNGALTDRCLGRPGELATFTIGAPIPGTGLLSATVRSATGLTFGATCSADVR